MTNVVSLQEIKNIVHDDKEYDDILNYIKSEIKKDIKNSTNSLEWKEYLQKTKIDLATGYFVFTLLKP